MANPISGAYQAQQTAPIHQTSQAANTTSKQAGITAAASQDKVTISQEAHAASQAQQAAVAQTSKPAADGDHDGS